MSQNQTSNYTEQGGARTVIGGSLDVASGGDLDIESGGALKIAGTAVTASAAELNALAGTGLSAAELGFLNGATAGTQVASKAVVADANVNIGVVKATAFHLGASGSETQVTSSAAELNKLDGVLSTAAEIDQRALTVVMALGTAGSRFVVVPFTWTLTNAYSVLDAAIATADEVLTLKNNAGSAVTNGAITITQAGSAAGDIDTATPTANNTFTAGQKLEIATNGGSDGGSATLTFLFTIT
jgi:hypothetical protein